MTMDLNQHLNKIVEQLVGEITSNVAGQVDSIISGIVANKLATYDFSTHIKDAATEVFEKRAAEYQIDSRKLESRIAEKITNTIDQIQANTAALMSDAVAVHVANTNFNQAMSDAVGNVINDRIKELVFPDSSINNKAINFTDFILSGDKVQGGIIQNFSSTGIDDRATGVALTILDHATVVENNLLTKDLTVEGAMTINGEFVVNGNVPTESEFYKSLVGSASQYVLRNLDNSLFDNYSNLIFDKIKKDGLDLTKIMVNGVQVIEGNKLAPAISESNLQKLGILEELRVSGESLLAETLYVTGKRVGINTIEPSAALSVWDDEIEIVAKKQQKDVGVIGTSRPQKLILMANGKDNAVLETDGSVSVNQLQIGAMKFSTADSPPSYISGRGHVVWNSNPNIGGPLGWICLGEARWANFGIID